MLICLKGRHGYSPQYTYDKDGKPIGLFISIDEWNELSKELQAELPQWQKEALDIELKAIEKNPESLLKGDEVKKQFFTR
jgi:hypothetical protein